LLLAQTFVPESSAQMMDFAAIFLYGTRLFFTIFLAFPFIAFSIPEWLVSQSITNRKQAPRKINKINWKFGLANQSTKKP